MEKYKVHVTTPGHKIVFRNKVLRTPVVFHNVVTSDLDVIKLQARRLMLKYTVELEGEKVVEPKLPLEPLDLTKEEDIAVEELEIKEPTTILERLLEDDK